jgi:endonuclease G
MARKRRPKRKKTRSQRVSLKIGVALAVIVALWGAAGEWYVHHSRKWLALKRETWPRPVTAALEALGSPLADFTDALGWTGHDAVYEYDEEPPSGSVFFAGAPVRTGSPAPDDIVILNRGEFAVGWSKSLRHPVWCAYHVTRDARYDAGKRPGFTLDKSADGAPRPDDYRKCGYDRGHMVPNYAIATRYGDEMRRKTFRMSNIAPQTPALNRGVWREVEHRIADLWTRRYGEIWVVVGAISPEHNRQTLPGGSMIDVPERYYQVIVAQEGMSVRALAVLFDQNVSWHEWAARNIVTIDELEKLTGLNFNPSLPDFIQSPMEAELPSRMWPIHPADIFKLVAIRFRLDI